MNFHNVDEEFKVSDEPEQSQLYDERLERLIAAIIIDRPELYGIYKKRIPVDVFYFWHIRDIFKVIEDHYDKHNGFDSAILSGPLSQKYVGDIALSSFVDVALKELDSMRQNESGDPSRHIQSYIDKVVEYYVIRQTQVDLPRFQKAFPKRDVSTAETLVAAMESFDKLHSKLQGFQNNEAGIGEAADRLHTERLSGFKQPKFPTGLKGMDEACGGGLFPAEASLLHARMSHGKTAIALQMTINLARAGFGVVFVSLEMSLKVLTDRLTSLAAYGKKQIPFNKIMNNELSEQDTKIVGEAVEHLGELPIYVSDRRGANVNDVVSIIRRGKRYLKEKHECECHVVFIDYLGLMEGRPEFKGNSHEQLGKLFEDLRNLSQYEDVHMFILHQSNREAENEKGQPPGTKHVSGSDKPSMHADNVFSAYRPAHDLKDKILGDEEAENKRVKELNKQKRDIYIHATKARRSTGGTDKYYCNMACNYIANL